MRPRLVLDRDGTFRTRCNTEMVELEPLLDPAELERVRALVENHVRLTRSALGRRVLEEWELLVPLFLRVMPTDYKRVLLERDATRSLRRAAGEG